jgi:uridylate kinase
MSKYKKVMFKVSGESMMGDKPFGHDLKAIEQISDQILKVYNQGIQICLVVGGGNLFRGVSVSADMMSRTSADYMGMLATVINGMALQGMLEKKGAETRMVSAIKMNTICEPYIKRKASRHLEKGRIVIFVAGTGNPFFTTDTASVLRAIEMDCDAIFKGTQVDGVYSADPMKDKNAKRYDKLSYNEAIQKDLRIMDPTALTLARDNNVKIVVFKVDGEDSFGKVVNGEGMFTTIE